MQQEIPQNKKDTLEGAPSLLTRSSAFSTVSACPSNWKKLEHKYLEYINLLKCKLQHAEKKLEKQTPLITKPEQIKEQLHLRALSHARIAVTLRSSSLRIVRESFVCLKKNLEALKKQKISAGLIQGGKTNEAYTELELHSQIDEKPSSKTSSSVSKRLREDFQSIEHKQKSSLVSAKAVEMVQQGEEKNLAQSTNNGSGSFKARNDDIRLATVLEKLGGFLNGKIRKQMRSIFCRIKYFKLPDSQTLLRRASINHLEILKQMLDFNILNKKETVERRFVEENVWTKEAKDVSNKYEQKYFRQLRETSRLEAELNKYKKQNTDLKDQLEKVIMERDKESKSKAQSLMQLEEEIREYEKTIKQLQNQLRAYRKGQKNVLAPNLAQFELEKHHLERARDDLEKIISNKDNEMQNLIMKLQEQNRLRTSLEIKLDQCEKELDTLKAYRFETSYESESVKVEKETLRQREKILGERWSNYLKVQNQRNRYQIALSKIHQVSDSQETQNSTLAAKLMQIKRILEGAKLKNEKEQTHRPLSMVAVSATDVLNVIEKMMDQEGVDSHEVVNLEENEKARIRELQHKIQRIKHITPVSTPNLLVKIPSMRGIQEVRASAKSSKMIDSLLDAFNVSEEVQSPANLEPKYNKPEPATARDTPSEFTAKLIQLEKALKNKDSIILDLKQNFMHTRQVILRFLASLDLRNLSSESDGNLGIIIDIFQYSEDEKALVLKQMKKPGNTRFFGIF